MNFHLWIHNKTWQWESRVYLSQFFFKLKGLWCTETSSNTTNMWTHFKQELKVFAHLSSSFSCYLIVHVEYILSFLFVLPKHTAMYYLRTHLIFSFLLLTWPKRIWLTLTKEISIYYLLYPNKLQNCLDFMSTALASCILSYVAVCLSLCLLRYLTKAREFKPQWPFNVWDKFILLWLQWLIF